MTAFERYAPFIQEYIYRKRWTDLREVQVEACNAIMDTDRHVIIASGTASGKTEAAFFPILTLLDARPSRSVGVLYIGPLKALINDQFGRLDELLDDSDIPVWPWHGDIPQSVKQRALRQGQGVLQITPESLEAMLMNHPSNAARLFSDLRFVVIDEIHSLMGTDRGLQLICLLKRLERVSKVIPRRIGLSATLNDYTAAQVWLAGGTTRSVAITGITHHKRMLSLYADSYLLPEDEKQTAGVMEEYNQTLYDACHNQKCLLFTNSRSGAETVIADLKDIAEARHEPDVFHVHHGSVSKELRSEAESALCETAGPTVVAATLTLELGIDIGDLDVVVQLGAPYSCTSFVQRLGRSGRRSGKSKMMFMESTEYRDGLIIDQMPWDLLRTIAIIQLYLEERWVEPITEKPKPFSLLVHQTLSTLMTYGELTPAQLAEAVLTLPAFHGCISQDEYRALLHHMLEQDILERMEDGELIVGLNGAKLTSYYTFYAVFETEDAWHVLNRDYEIGTLSAPPIVGEAFILAGKTWQTQAVDEERKIVYVVSAKNRHIPKWQGTVGDVHGRIIQRMKQVLLEDTSYPYLSQRATEHLSAARETVRQVEFLSHPLTVIHDGSFLLCPWCGSRTLDTIRCLLLNGLKDALQIKSVSGDYCYLQICTDMAKRDFIGALRQVSINIDDPTCVLSTDAVPTLDKYDTLVPQVLLQCAFLRNHMDVKYAMELLRHL